jgi:hypothetical protein
MAEPKLTWVQHELTIPDSSPLWSLTLGIHPARGRARQRLKLELPDLDNWPTPADKISLLLDKAAEVEHALMVQYLYATYSLKLPTAVSDPQQKEALKNWRSIKTGITGIAREEMGHLMTVQNLRLLVGLPPRFARENFPVVKGLFPFDTHLEPLNQETLAKYVVAESPPSAQGIDDIVKLAMSGAKMAMNRVGVLYALIGVVLAKNLGEIEQDAEGGDYWDVMVRQIAYLAYEQNPPSRIWHLPDGAFQAGSVARQGVQDDWAKGDPNVRIFTLKTRQDAKAAIKDIGVQGEGVGEPADMTSHFARFRDIYRGKGKIPAFPAAGGWKPTLDVPTDPKVTNDTKKYPGAISNPTTQPWAKLANLRYAILLGFLEEYLREKPVAGRDFLSRASLREMIAHLRGISAKLVTMDRTTSGGGKAALPFELPTADFPLPDDPTARRKVHANRLNEAIALEDKILSSASASDKKLLQDMQTRDKDSLKHFP